MTTNNNLDALFADAELPFGHPGRRSENTPEGFEPSPLVDQGPELDYTPDEYSRVVTTSKETGARRTHYHRSTHGPGDRPLCGNDSMTAAYTDDPALVAGCADCLELAAEDLEEDNEHWANCLHCQQEISARNGVEWRRVARAPCPHCGKLGW